MLVTTATRSPSISSRSSASLSLIWSRRLTPSAYGLEGPAVGGRGGRGHAAEVVAQRGGGAEADPPGDRLDRQVGLLEQAPRLQHPLREQPLQRRRPGFLAETAGEGPRADTGVARHRRHLQRLVEAFAGPAAGRLQRAGAGRRLGLEELRLPTFTVGRRDHVPGHPLARGDAEVAADDVQAEVDAGAEAGRGEHVALVDEE